MGDWEDEIPPLPAKEQAKSKWDDEDVDDSDVKESLEDEYETPSITMASNRNTLSLRSILEDKLNGTNFSDWYRNLRIVLKQERKMYVLESPLPEAPPANAPRAEKDAYKKHQDDALDVGCLMLATMNSELQKQHEEMGAFEMIERLKELYQEQVRQERYDTSKALFGCKMAEGTSVGPHVVKMIGYIKNLEKMGLTLGQELAIDVILQSLPDSYSQFVLNYNMNEIDRTLPQLNSRLRTAEANIKKAKPNAVLMVQKDKSKAMEKAKGKNKMVRKSRGKSKSNSALKPRGGVAKECNCFHCGETGHWKRNCKVYLEELKTKKKESDISTSETEKK